MLTLAVLSLVVLYHRELLTWRAELLTASSEHAASSALEQHVVRLEAESAHVEKIRLQAAALSDSISELERRGRTSSGESEVALAADAKKLKDRLAALARDAHVDPAQTLKDYAAARTATRRRRYIDDDSRDVPKPAHPLHYVDDDSRDWPKPAHSLHYIDDDSRDWPKPAHSHHYIDDDSREVKKKAKHASGINVGILGRTPQRKPARGRHHSVHDYSWDVAIHDLSWEAAPKQDEWGQEEAGKDAGKKKINFYSYGNPSKGRAWKYGPKESAFGSDVVPGDKDYKDMSFGNSWDRVKEDKSWMVAPKGDGDYALFRSGSSRSSAKATSRIQTSSKTAGKDLTTADEGKAWSAAEEWFKRMRHSTAKQVDAHEVQREMQQRIRRRAKAKMEAVEHVDANIAQRVEADIKLLKEAKAAEAAIRTAPGSPRVHEPVESDAQALPSRARDIDIARDIGARDIGMKPSDIEHRRAAPSSKRLEAQAPRAPAVARDVDVKPSRSPLAPKAAESRSAAEVKRKDGREVGGRRQGGVGREGALRRTEDRLKALMESARSKFGRVQDGVSADAAAQRAREGWQHVAEVQDDEREQEAQAVSAEVQHLEREQEARAPVAVVRDDHVRPRDVRLVGAEEGVGGMAAAQQQDEHALYAEVMKAELRKAQADTGKLHGADKASAEIAIATMRKALQGAKVSEEVMQRNRRRAAGLTQEIGAATQQERSLESDALVRRAEKAQDKVWRLQQQLQAATSSARSGWSGGSSGRSVQASSERVKAREELLNRAKRAAEAGAAEQGAREKDGGKVSSLAALGLNTGEGLWDDRKAPYHPILESDARETS